MVQLRGRITLRLTGYCGVIATISIILLEPYAGIGALAPRSILMTW